MAIAVRSRWISGCRRRSPRDRRLLALAPSVAARVHRRRADGRTREPDCGARRRHDQERSCHRQPGRERRRRARRDRSARLRAGRRPRPRPIWRPPKPASRAARAGVPITSTTARSERAPPQARSGERRGGRARRRPRNRRVARQAELRRARDLNEAIGARDEARRRISSGSSRSPPRTSLEAAVRRRDGRRSRPRKRRSTRRRPP